MWERIPRLKEEVFDVLHYPPGRLQNVCFWPISAAPTGRRRDRYQRTSYHAAIWSARQLMTHIDRLPLLVDALQKDRSITSAAATSRVSDALTRRKKKPRARE